MVLAVSIMTTIVVTFHPAKSVWLTLQFFCVASKIGDVAHGYLTATYTVEPARLSIHY